jgi:hypothetical protein
MRICGGIGPCSDFDREAPLRCGGHEYDRREPACGAATASRRTADGVSFTRDGSPFMRMSIRFLVLTLLCLVVAGVRMFVGQVGIAAQGGIAGSWRSKAAVPVTLVLRTNGSSLTGVIDRCASTQIAPTELSDGRVDGNVITFRCTSPDGDRTVSFTGRLAGDLRGVLVVNSPFRAQSFKNLSRRRLAQSRPPLSWNWRPRPKGGPQPG